MRILITGAHGKLGQDMVLAATECGFDTLACPRSALDNTSAEAVNQAIETSTPDLVVNCAAWTAAFGIETKRWLVGVRSVVDSDTQRSIVLAGVKTLVGLNRNVYHHCKTLPQIITH